jgi:predicted MFS family arabinose efflux permease
LVSRRPPLIFIFAVTLTGILNTTLLSPAIPNILDEFDVPPSGAGLLVASGSVVGILMAPVVGLLADRFGRRIVLTGCLFVFGLSGSLAALAPTYGFLIGARLMQGFGSAGLVNLAIVLIGDHWTGATRTRIVGRNAAVLTVGLAAWPLISGSVVQVAGWRVSFGIYTVALLMAAAAWMILDGRRPPTPPRVGDQIRESVLVARRPAIAAAVVIGFLVFVLIFGLFLTVFPLHLANEFGMDAAARGLMIGLPAAGSTVMAFNLGKVRRVLSTRTAAIIAATGLVAAFVTLGLTTVIVMAGLAVIVYGASQGLLIPSLQDLAIHAATDSHRGAVMAVWVAAARLGQTVGPLAAGIALAALDTGLTLVAGTSVAVLILVMALFGSLPHSDQRQQHVET